jgi:hypothetical protein
MAKASASKTFKARIEGEGPGGAWTRVQLPFDVERTWGSKGRVSVKGTINGFAFRSSIFPNGDGTHHMMINKAMKEGATAGAGDAVNITMAPDTEERTVDVPADLKKAVSGNRAASALFAQLGPSCRKEYVEWIEGARRAETRTSRIEKAVEYACGGEEAGEVESGACQTEPCAPRSRR